MSRYSTIAETLWFQATLCPEWDIREFGNGVTTPRVDEDRETAHIDMCDRRVRSAYTQPILSSRSRPRFQCGLIPLSTCARKRGRDRERGVATHGVFRPLDPCAWCNTDHTSIHCKWTSILVINTSRLSLGSLSSPASVRGVAAYVALPAISSSSSTLHPDRLHDHRNARRILARDLHVSDTRVGGSDWRLSRCIVSGRVCNSAASYERTRRNAVSARRIPPWKYNGAKFDSWVPLRSLRGREPVS